jgi:hypothetical protein
MIVDWNKETVRREGYFQALLDVKNEITIVAHF